MDVLTKAELPSSRGDACINFNVYEYLEVSGVAFAVIKLEIDASDWPSNELLDSQRDLTSQIEDHKIILNQLVVSIKSLVGLSVKIKNWIASQELFEIELVDLNFQSSSVSLVFNDEKISDVSRPYFVFQYKGNKISILRHEIKVDQSCLNCFCEGLDSIVALSKA